MGLETCCAQNGDAVLPNGIVGRTRKHQFLLNYRGFSREIYGMDDLHLEALFG